MTFMAKLLMLSLLLLGISACGLAQSCIPLEVQPFDYTLDVHGTRYAGTAVVSPVSGEPVYELTGEEGPNHNKKFTVQVLIREQVYGTGSGRTKKAAEQEAAYAALLKLKK